MTERSVPSFIGVTLIVFALLTLWATPAGAIETHAFTGTTIGPAGAATGGQFTDLASVTVDSSGNIYVLDTANHGRLYKFDSSGEPLDFTATGTNYIDGTGGFKGQTTVVNQVAIAPLLAPGGTGSDIYIANDEVVKVYSPTGLELGQLTLPATGLCGVAVDAAGDVFTKNEHTVVQKYTPKANPPTDADAAGTSTVSIPSTCNLAVDGKGRIYAAGYNPTPIAEEAAQELWRLESLTAETKQLFDPHASSMTVEPVTDSPYVSHGTEIVQYAEDGSLISKFGEGRLVESPGLAIADAGGDVYVASRRRSLEPFSFSGRIDVFGPLVTLPKAVAKAPSAITKAGAVLNGTIDADAGPAANCKFEYTTQAAFVPVEEAQRLTVAATGGTFTLSFVNPAGGTARTTTPIAYDAEAGAVQAALQALPDVGTGNVFVTGGSDGHGTLAPYSIRFVGGLSDQNLEQVSVDSSGLTGGGTPKGEVQTVTDGQAGGFAGATSAPCAPGGPFTGNTVESVSTALSGLSAGTEYRYRLIGENENGRLGSDENGSEPKGAPGFETLAPLAARTGVAEDLTTTSVTLTGSIDPEGVAISECFFEYGETEAYGAKAPCEAPGAGEIGSGNAPVAVHAHISALTAGTGYHFRLAGTSSEFPGVFARGADVTFGTLAPPQVVSQSFSKVGQATATISGSVNPHSSPTTYLVEYVTQTEFGQSGYATAKKVPVAGVPIGSGFTAVAVGQTLGGLMPGTKYHFRLFAENGLGHAEGPDAVFTTQAGDQLFGSCPANEAFRVEQSSALPDCRAYEQASSPDKNGGSVGGLYTQMFASEDGSAVTFYTAAFALPPALRGGAQNYPTYLASRDAATGSWSSQRLLPPQEFGELAEYLGSTPDLRYAVVEAGTSVEKGLFSVDTDTGAVTQVVPYQLTGSRIPWFGLDGLTADGSRIFFESRGAIPTVPSAPTPEPGKINLYMWERASGDVSLVGILPGGEVPSAGSFGGAFEWYEYDNTTVGGALNTPQQAAEPLAVAALHAISPSGEQVFFTAAGTGQLYLRRGLGGPSPTTVRISSPNRGIGSPEKPAAFQEATPADSRAFFISRQKLTIDANTGPDEEGMDLYRWDTSAQAGKSLSDIAPDGADPNGAEVRGLLGAAPDGSSGYFVAGGVLGDAAQKGVDKPGGENLYRFEEEGGGHFHISFLATLGDRGADRRNISPKVFVNERGRTSRMSDDGDTLLFTTSTSVPTREFPAGYDNSNLEGIDCGGGRCPELYIYSAATREVTCVSCDPSGEAPIGAADLQDQIFNAYFNITLPPAVSFSRNLSADGSKVFFQTPDPLVAADTNGAVSCHASGGEVGKHNLSGTGHCQDVYEWEAVGSGSCKAAEANGGCLYLISTGKSDEPSYFVGASKDGSNAFIATTSRLVPADRDQADDVYDVRVDGGLASQHVTAQSPCVSTESCKGPASSPAPAVSPATPSFQGAGNAKVTQCKKGSVRKGRKCVKKSANKKHHKKRHHKKKKRLIGQRSSGGAK